MNTLHTSFQSPVELLHSPFIFPAFSPRYAFKIVSVHSFVIDNHGSNHELICSEATHPNILLAPSSLLKFTTSIEYLDLNFCFTDLNTCSTGAISGQYGGKNCTSKLRSAIIFFVNLEVCVDALSIIAISLNISSAVSFLRPRQ